METICWDQKSLRALRKSKNINTVDRWENSKLYAKYQMDDKVGPSIELGQEAKFKNDLGELNKLYKQSKI